MRIKKSFVAAIIYINYVMHIDAWRPSEIMTIFSIPKSETPDRTGIFMHTKSCLEHLFAIVTLSFGKINRGCY